MRPAVCIFALCLALILPQSCKESGEKTRKDVSVKVMKVTYSREAHPQVFVGRVEAGKTSLVSANYPGRLVKMNVRKGQRVKGGTVLATIDSPGVKSMYETAKASFEQAKDGLDRVNQVYSTGSVTELKLVEVKTSYAKAQAAFDAASRALDDCNVKAPYDGVIGEILLEEGVEAGAAEPVFRFLDVSSVEIHASVPENEYAAYSLGQAAEIQVDAASCRVDAVLTNKGIEASALSHSYDFVFALKSHSAKILPGMVCKVYMNPSSAESVVIPASCVRVDSEGRYVWCIGTDGAVVKRHIKVNGFTEKGIVVEEGLVEGDMLVTEGGRKISSGMKNIEIEQD